VDIVIEGKITTDEGMADILQTVIDLKNLPNAILRLTSLGDEIQGRIAFAQGGYILGGRVNNTDETGYPAVRKLLSITEGNYAILDPGRTHVADVNQTLWIKASRVLDYLPTLPPSPEVFLDGADVNSINTTVEKAQFDPMDLRAHAPDERGTSGLVANKKSKTRTFDLGTWRILKVLFLFAVVMLLAVGITQYWDQILAYFHGTPATPAPASQSAPPQ
jgi:hypothetical protein